MRTVIAFVAVIFFAVSPVRADPAGQYEVRGTNPSGGSAYEGTVSVERTGDAYRVIWQIGTQFFIGTGVLDGSSLAIWFQSGSFTGVALYAADGDNWKGKWVTAGGTELGSEQWQRKQ
jgi:hypothetical protein